MANRRRCLTDCYTTDRWTAARGQLTCESKVPQLDVRQLHWCLRLRTYEAPRQHKTAHGTNYAL